MDRLTAFYHGEGHPTLKDGQECLTLCPDGEHQCTNPECAVQRAIDRLYVFELALEQGSIVVERSEVNNIIQEVCKMHPYKVPGDYDSYTDYNQGWEDACNSIEARLHPAKETEENSETKSGI